MNLSTKLKNLCIKLGTNNKPTYAVIAIAIAKGIFRPIFTLADKKESPETKKYAAIREGLTELVAIPTYWTCGELAGKIGKKITASPEKQAIASHNFMFLGVCTVALLIIPALTSLIIKPVMKLIQSKHSVNESTNKHLDIKEEPEKMNQNISQLQVYNTKSAFKRNNYVFNNVTTFNSHDIKVGV